MSNLFQDNSRIAVIGAGVFGTALAGILAENNPDSAVDIWSYEKSVSVQINLSRVNTKYLPEYRLPENISSSSSLKSVIENADMVFLTTPAKFAAEIMESAKDAMRREALFIICTKGITSHKNEFMPVFSAAEKILGSEVHVAVLSGPSHVNELLAHKFSTWIFACRSDEKVFRYAENVISGGNLLLKRSENPLGTELGGILKNAAAIIFGITGRMTSVGENFSGVLFSECLREMHEVFRFYGAGIDELLSESGVGDLAATCFSLQSRNKMFGEQVFLRFNTVFKRKFFIYRLFRMIFPKKFKEPEMTVKFLAEGAFTIRPLVKIANSSALKIPLFRALLDVLSAKRDMDFLVTVAMDPESYFSRTSRSHSGKKLQKKRGFLMRLLMKIFSFFFSSGRD